MRTSNASKGLEVGLTTTPVASDPESKVVLNWQPSQRFAGSEANPRQVSARFAKPLSWSVPGTPEQELHPVRVYGSKRSKKLAVTPLVTRNKGVHREVQGDPQ